MRKEAETQRGSLRLIAGKWRSRRLSFPALDGLRPTPARVRETLFNWLQDRIALSRCLDLFAGSGACGMEALSRGAAHVTFVDSARPAIDSITSNLKLLGAGNADIICNDALGWLEQSGNSGSSYEIVFLDPPFAAGMLPPACRLLERSGLLSSDAMIYLETEEDLLTSGSAEVPATWTIAKRKRAGSVYYYLCKRAGDSK